MTANTVQLTTLEEQLVEYNTVVQTELSIEKLKDYLDDPETLNEKARTALLPTAPNILVGLVRLAYFAKSEQVKLSALKELKTMLFGDTKSIGLNDSELDRFLKRITSPDREGNDDLPTNLDL